MKLRRKYTLLAIGIVLIFGAVFIFVNLSQPDLIWWKMPLSQPAEQVKDDPYISLINEGDEYWTNGSTTDAIKLWKIAEILDPSRPEAYTVESMPATGTKKMRLLNLAVSKTPPYAPAYELRAWAYENQGKYQLALADATKALEMGDYNYRVYQSRAIAYRYLGQFGESLNDIQQALSLNPSDPFSLVQEGFALYGLGLCQEASDTFDTAVESSHGDKDVIGAWKNFLTLDASNCSDIPQDSGQEPPAPTSTSTDNSMTGIGV